jgi:hypothetical protein
MADRLDYYFRQRVSEAELDLAFELLEKADRNLAADIGVYGVVSGAVPAPHSPVPDLTVDLTAPGRAYDRLGQRIFFGTGQQVDCAVDENGIPTEVSGAGRERWLGVFLRFDRLLSDPRTDGNSQQVYFRRDESFKLVVRQGVEGNTGTAPKVALQSDELLVCDIRRTFGQTQIVAGDIDVSRRQAFIFATGDAVQIASALWSALAPAVNTVQAALDSADALLAGHFAGTGHRHAASAIDCAPHGFVAATNVQAALNELVDDLSSTTSGSPGALRVGADAVTGTPNAMAAGNVDGQLSQLLGFINNHLGAVTGAHNASAISAATHAHIEGTNVQSQLQEIVSDLLSQTAGSPGAIRVGADAVSGSPTSLAAGTVDAQLASLLSAINSHVANASGAHAASAISVADSGGNLTATNVETALAEAVDALEVDHFRGNESNAGQHRTIHQPNLGGSKALLWDSLGNGGTGAHFRVYADSYSIWFTVNASWNGSAWTRDNTGWDSGGFRFSGWEFEIVYQSAASGTFMDFERRWLIQMSGGTNSAFVLTGAMEEQGRLGTAWSNTASTTQSVAAGGSCTFRSRFEASPSSITLKPRARIPQSRNSRSSFST